MLKSIHHRGPDDQGIWSDGQSGLVLGHRRLSILDLSAAGHQPMTSACGRFVVVFNGEIYNHLELRRSLEQKNEVQRTWRGHSDTETLLAAISSLGVVEALKKAVGMFALAVWDKQERKLLLARDRLGEKPLYYGWQNGVFLFGSELKALKAHHSFAARINWRAAALFLRRNYIPAPATIYEGIYKLRPGSILSLAEADIAAQTLPEPIPYWSVLEVAAQGAERPFHGAFQDAVDELEALLSRAVKEQSLADVPVGAFLSGGIDSSTIVALMRSVTTSDITTFSIGMADSRMDESQHAARVAAHLKTNHVGHLFRPGDALNLIPKLPEIWDEPFGDISQLPTYLVSMLARERVTVALSGDGGDEFFLGYPRYVFCQRLWRTRVLGKFPWNAVLNLLPAGSGSRRTRRISRWGRTLAGAWRQPSPQSLYRYLMDNYRGADLPLRGEYAAEDFDCVSFGGDLESFSVADALTYLPDDIMTKVDRAAMANSLETRAPLLDHRIVEFAYTLPEDYKIGGFTSKRVLRELLYRYVPKEIVDRPKMGFSVPMSAWLKGELRQWSEDLLLGESGGCEPFDQAAVQALWNDHLIGVRDNTEQLWGLLTLKSWLKAQ